MTTNMLCVCVWVKHNYYCRQNLHWTKTKQKNTIIKATNPDTGICEAGSPTIWDKLGHHLQQEHAYPQGNGQWTHLHPPNDPFGSPQPSQASCREQNQKYPDEKTKRLYSDQASEQKAPILTTGNLPSRPLLHQQQKGMQDSRERERKKKRNVRTGERVTKPVQDGQWWIWSQQNKTEIF